MPLYDFKCMSCGETQELYKTLAEIDDAFHCDERMTRLVTMKNKTKLFGYYSEALDCYIPDAKTKSRRMKELGAAEVDTVTGQP